MTLKRQLILSFFLVAVLPLLLTAVYLTFTNVSLAFDLYGKNLQNSTQIQTDLLTEQMNQFLLRSKRISVSKVLLEYFSLKKTERPLLLDFPKMTEEILKFTDETLDSVRVFAFVDEEGEILYSSGSTQDIVHLEEQISKILLQPEEEMFELSWGESADSLASVTKIKVGKEILGFFVVVYSNDYFLKMISSHRQIESSNSFLFCTNHNKVVEAKLKIEAPLSEFQNLSKDLKEGSVKWVSEGETHMAHYQNISKTSWILVNSIPTHEIYMHLSSYVVLSISAVFFGLMVIFFLARQQNRKILSPFYELLKEVENFFRSGKRKMSRMQINKKTEIGYLADQFERMTESVAAAQHKLQESNYLYEAILQATYEFLLVIDFDQNQVITEQPYLKKCFIQQEKGSISEKVFSFLTSGESTYGTSSLELIERVTQGEILKQTEAEVCCLLPLESWYRIIAVPIRSEKDQILKVVIHFENITQKKLEEMKLLETSQKEPLTGLLNKRAFIQLAQNEMLGQCSLFTLFFIDLDNFKQVNDKLGHTMGDTVLIEMAQKIKALFRNSDLVGRYGGDEFIVFAPELSKHVAKEKAKILTEQLQIDLLVPKELPIHVSASIGVYLYYEEQELSQRLERRKLENMIQAADKAMYRAKEKGKSQYFILEGEEES